VHPILAAAEAAHPNPLLPQWNELIWGLATFVIVFTLLHKLALRPLHLLLAERSANIDGKLEQAARDRTKAQQLQEQYEQQLADAHAEAQRLVTEALANAGRLERELLGEAEEHAARILQQAKDTIEGERDRALQSLRGELSGLAVDLASRVLGESLDREHQLRLVDQYLDEVTTVSDIIAEAARQDR
jgi:F-type H+-transporting ATPase subunit b